MKQYRGLHSTLRHDSTAVTGRRAHLANVCVGQTADESADSALRYGRHYCTLVVTEGAVPFETSRQRHHGSGIACCYRTRPPGTSLICNCAREERG